MLQIGDRFGQGLACKVVGEGFGYAAALPESLRVRSGSILVRHS